MQKEDELNIIIPVFNESETIINTLKNILSIVSCDFKILICYDYDEDPTLKIIRQNFQENPKILYIKNHSTGFNNAIISGFNISNAKAVMIFMSDDHINHNIINLCYEKFKEGYEVVCPSRFINKGKMIGGPFFKGLLARLVSVFLFNFTNFPIKDSTNNFRLFSKKLISNIQIESQKGFTLSLELTAKAHRLGYKMIEVPSIWKERDKGKSRFRLFSFLIPYLKWFFYKIATFIFKKNAK